MSDDDKISGFGGDTGPSHDSSGSGTASPFKITIPGSEFEVKVYRLFYSQLENIVRDVKQIGGRERLLSVSISVLITYIVSFLFVDINNLSNTLQSLNILFGIIIFFFALITLILYLAYAKDPKKILDERLAEYDAEQSASAGTAQTRSQNQE